MYVMLVAIREARETFPLYSVSPDLLSSCYSIKILVCSQLLDNQILMK